MATKNTNQSAPSGAGSKALNLGQHLKVGVVVSTKMQKTVVVAVENLVKHGMYQKYIKRTNKFLAHNERPDISIGDRVVIEETRPLSKRKRWNVREVLEKAS
jgi:small subunit ribosomal protein S17